MKTIACLFPLLFSIAFAFGQVSFGEAVKLNDGWKFQKGDIKDAAQPGFNDSKWRQLDLPHDWSVEGPLSPTLASCTGYLPGGIAWYRKTFQIPAGMKDKKVFIYFEGIYRNGEVFVNGASAGMRPNGYVSHMYDITPSVHSGGTNTIAVRVDHSKSADSRWYTGSGIYRDVYLLYAHPIHIDLWGVYCTAPQVNERQAILQVQTTLQNSSAQTAQVTLVQELLAGNNTPAGKVTRTIGATAGKSTVTSQEMKVSQPKLWTLESPHLYRLRTSVYLGEELIDSSSINVGVRTLAFDPDKGFALNGESIKVKGVCLHHDAGSLGSAVPREVWERRLLNLKSLGCNAIRTSHNPQAPVLYDLCDQHGLLVMNEAFDEWEFPKKKWLEGWNVGTPGFEGPAEFFEKWAEIDLRDMVLRDRNHPSVFLWSIGNEVDYPNDPYSHPILSKEGIGQQHTRGYLPDQPNAARLGAIAKRLAAVVKQYDASRPATAGLAGPVMSNETEYPGALDVVGYNYSENRYAKDHTAYPKRILYGSENGQSMESWKAVRDNDFIFGQFLWTGIDYLGESHRWPSRGFTSGLLDLAGYKKPRAWFRQSLWSDVPMIYIGTTPNKNIRQNASTEAFPLWNYSEGDPVRIICYTNCSQARLLLNGQPVGEMQNQNRDTGVIFWDMPFRAGKLEAVGYAADKEAARYSIETCKRPNAIKASAVNRISASSKGVAQIEIQIVDEDGKAVFNADNEITCLASGPVRLLGLEASNPADMGDYTDNKQRVFQGKMIAYIQSTGVKGKALINFTSPWLNKAVVELDIE